MYEYLIGMVTIITPYHIVLEVAGVGFQLQVANPFAFSAKKKMQMKLFVHQVVREDSQLLFGFAEVEEKNLFLKLISVSGIGPKSALAILAGEDHDGLVLAIENEDVKYLTKFPGVGQKTAKQMILDLKGKLGELVDGEVLGVPQVSVAKNEALDEAIEALKALGYKEKELLKLQKDLGKQVLSTDAYLRLGLKQLMKK